MEEQTIEIKPLDLNIIQPTWENKDVETQGGYKIAIIAAPGRGKSTLVKAIMYAKQKFIHTAKIMSGSESCNDFYKQFCPQAFIHEEYNEEALEDFVKRQKVAKHECQNPWSFLIIDDCMEDPKLMNRQIQHKLMKNGRHFKILYMLCLQYSMDVPPFWRSNCDVSFIFREGNPDIRKKTWTNFANVIPSLKIFNELMDTICGDYTALVVLNGGSGNESKEWWERVFWFKAPIIPDDWKFGSPIAWQFSKERFDKSKGVELW